MAAKRRSIVREHEFEEQLDALICNAEEAEGFIAPAEDILSEDPTLGSLADAGPPEIWTLALPSVRDRAGVSVLDVDKSVVILLHVVAYD